MCALCKEKPETAFDNFVGAFGLRFLEVSGEGYKAAYEGNPSPVDVLMRGLERCREFE